MIYKVYCTTPKHIIKVFVYNIQLNCMIWSGGLKYTFKIAFALCSFHKIVKLPTVQEVFSSYVVFDNPARWWPPSPS